MIKLKGLEDWARAMLATPISTLNRRFGSWKKEEELRKSIEELPFFTHYRPVFRQISEPTLRELHQKLRGQKCETNFWNILLELLDHPLPKEVAFGLIEGNIARSWLAHSNQSEEVWWRLVPLVDDAILTIAAHFYTSQSYSLEEFEAALHQFPDFEWMLVPLSYCSASSLEKRHAFEASVEGHPKRNLLLETNPRIDAHQVAFENFDLGYLSYSQQIEALYGPYDAQKLLDIARDDATPDEILLELEELRGFGNASQVRFAARDNLRRRAENEPDSPL